MPRLIASYGRRHGRRLRPGKLTLIETLLPQLEIKLLETGMVEPSSLFEQKKPIWFEIGYGGGEHLAHQAALYPEANFIGCETYVDGIASMLSHINEAGLKNIRLFTEDARLLMERLPDKSLERVFVLYPDPWPKTRHHKRRIISKDFLEELTRLMTNGAQLRLATDYADYATWMLERLLSHPQFEWTARTCDDWLNPWADWISTRYEQKALAGRPTYLNFIRK